MFALKYLSFHIRRLTSNLQLCILVVHPGQNRYSLHDKAECLGVRELTSIYETLQ